MRTPCDVVITGIGVISPVGNNPAELSENLRRAVSGIHLWESPRLEKKFPAGIVRQEFSDQFTKLELPYLDRCSQMAVLAARQAINDAGFGSFSEYGERAGLYYGSVKAGFACEEEWFRQYLLDGKEAGRPYSIFAIMHNAAAAHISIRHQVLGPVMTHSSACTSSGTAIGDAYRAIRDGYLDVAVAGGADAPLAAALFGAWDGTRTLAPPDESDVGRSCKPFSKSRTGLVLGEGAAFIVLESARHAAQRKAACYARLAGYGIASDAYHIGSPKMDGQAIAMRAALDDAGMEAKDIDYINAHATATRGGDVVETNAIRAAFADDASKIPVSSTKSVHGHLLGAASVLELSITVLSMVNSIIPATTNLDDIDPDCPLNHVANSPLVDHRIDRAMSFSSGLGGTNVALIVAKCPEMGLKHPAGSMLSI